MAYGLYRKGKGGSLRKISGNPRTYVPQKNLIVWGKSKKEVKSWIKKYGTKTQKDKHLK